MLIKTVKTRWTLRAAMCLICLFCQSGTNAQSSGNVQPDQTTDQILESFASSKVLNMVMPKTLELNGEITLALTVRVEPSFDEEFQYVLLKRRNGEIEVIKRRSASGNIHYKITDIEQQASVLTVVEMAKLIHVLETRTSISPSKFKQLVGDLDIAVREHERRETEQLRRNDGKHVPSNQRDGTHYVIWMAGEKKYDLSVQGHTYKSPAQKDESPLIAWVRQLVKEL